MIHCRALDRLILAAFFVVACVVPGLATEPVGTTSLTNEAVRFRVSESGYHVMHADDVEAVIVDNRAVDDAVLPGHRASYSGLAKITYPARGENLFVPSYAGLNFEHIHDGTTRNRKILFEPRHAANELRIVNERIAELYWPPTPTYALECCLRYELLADGVVELTIECIPRAKTFKRGYIGLFFASYIDQPESLDIHFKGVDRFKGDDGPNDTPRWIRGITPRHGQRSTHLAIGDDRTFSHDADFPLSLVFNRSNHRYSEPWYYGVSHSMAWLQVFRGSDNVRITQSPSGGGGGDPAWDFQYLIDDYKVDQLYRAVMRAIYLPMESPATMARVADEHRMAMEQ